MIISIPPQAKVVLSAVAGALGSAVVYVLPPAFGYGDAGREPLNWLVLGWPGVWVFGTMGAALITIPLTFLVFALGGLHSSAAAPLARQAYQRANAVHSQPDHDREMGMLSGGLAGLTVCAAVPSLLDAWSTAPPDAAFRGNALAALVVACAILAGIFAKLVFLELQRWNPTY